MPSTPHHASVVITVCPLEVFRVMQLRCPRLGIQAFVRGLCDLHVVAPRPYLGAQFSTAFNVYLSLRTAADQRMKAALGRDIPNWRLKNACPACLYELEGEPKLKRHVIITQDGNNSLKRFGWRERVVRFDGTVVPGDSRERYDCRQAPGDFFLPRSDVEVWAKDEVDELMKDFVPEAGEGGDEGAGCKERWENMKEDVTACAWGLYDETGIFPALCRHGFVLVVVDMVQSGELAKYGLSVINHLPRVLGEVTVGIDVGCKVARQVKAHPQLSVLAKENKFKAVVGAFHGLGHGRLCSICNMAMYVDGMGLEDCENCESYFAKSNALAPTTCYSTVFHRQQAISTYMCHTDLCDAYQGLTIVITNKYRHTLKIKQGLPALHDAMRALNVSTRDVFETWLTKEKEYLQSMKKEPEEETMEMDYYQKLANLHHSEERLQDIRRVNVFIPAATNTTYAEAAKQTRRLETQRRHAGEVVAKNLAAVQDLELRLGIEMRWVAGGKEWAKAALMLQGLVVARMFELAKMNMSGTGYKLCKHIAKALQVRSKAVKTALQKYNDAAAAMDPPKPELTWEKVVEYAFLAEFDLLHEGREDICNELWALPAGRVAMDQHFKMLCANEEIERLNLEIPRLLTYMADEREFLIHHEERLCKEGNTALAHQVRTHRLEYGRFDDLHRQRLIKLAKEPGFTASLSRGVKQRPGGDVEMPDALDASTHRPQNADEGEDEEEEDDMDAIAEAFENIVHIAHDAEAAAGAG
ncbi:hypothetical protein DFH08DRAFT_916828 [Mycena albidolilacea]|uniref:CxC3 like cysteine cluster domain-containing protein n=1 Tax=Mycena albidolilacea TaxID=1033008 RepID=A0AAD6ZKV2_9AGAR|nr:hypothetical protein DFH08DRAFT_916828 [Mycena albidolilacea]